jgi:hypothetical protein
VNSAAGPVKRTEEPITDRVRDIEIVTHHQCLVVMQDVIPAQAAYGGQPAEPGLRIQVIREME